MKPAALIVGNFLSRSLGTRAVCEELAERLAAAGWSVRTASRFRNRPLRLADMLAAAGNPWLRADVAQVDVFSGPAFRWAEAVCWTLRRRGVPYVLTLHGGALPQFARRERRRVARLLASAAAVTAPSSYLQQALKALRPDIELLPNAVDGETFRFRLREKAEPRLIWVRAFHRIYNPVLAVRVAAGLAKEFPHVRLTMVGPDKGDGSFDETRREARALGVEARISFPGPVPNPELPESLDASGVFLNTSSVDNAPRSVMEALSVGLPVVSTSAGGLPQLVEHGTDGLLSPPGEAAGLIRSVAEILGSPPLARRLSEAGRHKAQTFNWPAVLARWERLLFSAARNGAARSPLGTGPETCNEPSAAAHLSPHAGLGAPGGRRPVRVGPAPTALRAGDGISG